MPSHRFAFTDPMPPLHIDRFSRPGDQMLPPADPELDLAPYEADTADTIPAPPPAPETHMPRGWAFSD